MSLYNEERPMEFSSVKGQDKVVRVLSNDLVNHSPKQAYLFVGVRGTGKTSVARIFAQAVNCRNPKPDGSPCGECDCCKEIRSGSFIDVVELDAASNNSVDDIRNMLEQVMYKPLHSKKVFILDECHMLSNAASNALLKVLEEPPQDVIFILCTTEFQKVLPTIISRCSRCEFERIPLAVLVEHMETICNKHSIPFEKNGLELIAKAANGGMRDALSILDNFFSLGEVKTSTVIDTLGMTSKECVFSLLFAIADRNAVSAINVIVRDVVGRGRNLSYLIEDIFTVLLDMTEFQTAGNIDSIIGDESYTKNVVDLAYSLSSERAFQIMDSLREVYQSHGNEFSMIASMTSLIYNDCQQESLRLRIDNLETKVTSLEANITNYVGEADTANAYPQNIEKSISENSYSNEKKEFDTPTVSNCASVSAGDGSCNDEFPFAEEVPDSANSNLECTKVDSNCTRSVVPESAPCNDEFPFAEEVPDFADSNLEQNSINGERLESLPNNDSSASEVSNSQNFISGMSFDEMVSKADSLAIAKSDASSEGNNQITGKEKNASSSMDSASEVSPSNLLDDAFARLWNSTQFSI